MKDFILRQTKMSHLLAHFCLYIAFMGFASIAGAQQNDNLGLMQETSSVLSEQQQKQYTKKLERIRTLVRANVVNLAENLLVNDAPPAAPNELWFAWQQQLWALYKSTQNWHKLLDASSNVPPTFPENMQMAALEQKIKAQLALGKFSAAREVIRRQILVNSQSGQSLKIMRQLLIESYLKSQQFDDADAAMQLFESEYRNNDVEWFRIKARLLIEQSNYDAAINELAPYSDPLSDLIKLHARVLNGSLAFDEASEQLAEYLLGEYGASLSLYAHDILVQGAQYDADSEKMIIAIEHYLGFLLSNTGDAHDNENLIAENKAELLNAYAQLSNAIANDEAIFVDDVEQLYELVQQGSFNNATQRAIYAQILRQSDSLTLRRDSANAYVQLLIEDELTHIVPIMFAQNNSLGNLLVDANTQLQLVNQALVRENYNLAAFVAKKVSKVPAGVDEDLWLLQNARIAILSNDLQLTKKHLDKWFTRNRIINAQQADQVVQPLFDLQKVGQHSMAIPYFQRLLSQVTSPRHQREVSFWLAESYEATENYSDAADFYLSSALMRDNGFDQWGEASRFRAAECLLNEGLYADARNLFETLLARSENPQRQNQLKQKIQELQLRQSTEKDNKRL